MPKNRVIYNVEGLFVGPAPSSGFHFLDSSGKLHNNSNLPNNINLVSNITRVQSIAYSFNMPVTSPLAFGGFTSIKRFRPDPPTININFDYIQHGVLNERRMGLYTNFPLFDELTTGTPFYTNNYGVFLLSGFTYRGDELEKSQYNWPMAYRDKRNIFVAVNTGYTDLNTEVNVYHPVAVNSKGVGVYGFGNCYFNSYRAVGAVGELPRVSVAYIGENMAYYNSGSGAPIPAINPKDKSPIPNKIFSIPTMYQGVEMPSVFLPGDITVDVTAFGSESGVNAIYGTGITGGYNSTNPFGLGVNLTDIKIQNYEISFDINRKDITSFGYAYPIDRVPKHPIAINVTIGALLGDSQSGSLLDAMRLNHDYNIAVKMRNPYKFGARLSGTALRYDILGAKLITVDYNSAIGSNKTVNFTFVSEFDPKYLRRGLFMSGLLNISGADGLSDYLVTEIGDFITDEAFNYTVVGNQFMAF